MNNKQVIELMSEEPPHQKTPVSQMITSFIIRDFKVWWSYKLWTSLELAGTILFVVTYYLFSLITTSQQVQEAGYAIGGYFTFALIGIAFQRYVTFAAESIHDSIRDEQRNGTIETILSSATDFKTFLLGEVCFSFIISSTFLLISLLAGVLLGANFNFTPLSILSAILLSLLLIASHMAIGVLNAGIIMKTQQGNPLTWAFSWVTQLISGVFYPLKLLPWYLEWIGRMFPLTYSLDGIRLCLQSAQDLSSSAVLSDTVSLIIFTVLCTPISLYIFKKGYNAARRDGSLGQY